MPVRGLINIMTLRVAIPIVAMNHVPRVFAAAIKLYAGCLLIVLLVYHALALMVPTLAIINRYGITNPTNVVTHVIIVVIINYGNALMVRCRDPIHIPLEGVVRVASVVQISMVP